MEEMLDESSANSNQGQVTKNMVNYIKGAAPWMKFISIFSMIFIILGLIGLLFMMAQVGAQTILIVSFLIYGLYLYLLILLLKTGNGYSKFANSNRPADLESALKAQKDFWMISGIIVIVSVIIFIAMLLYIESNADALRAFN